MGLRPPRGTLASLTAAAGAGQLETSEVVYLVDQNCLAYATAVDGFRRVPHLGNDGLIPTSLLPTQASPGLNLISAQVAASNVSAIDFVAGISSAYDEYELHYLLNATGEFGGGFDLVASINAGSSWLTSNGDYGHTNLNDTDNSTLGQKSAFVLCDQDVVTSGNSPGVAGTIKFYNLGGAKWKMINHFGSVLNRGDFLELQFNMGVIRTTSPVNGLRIRPDANQIAAGSWARLYGVRKS